MVNATIIVCPYLSHYGNPNHCRLAPLGYCGNLNHCDLASSFGYYGNSDHYCLPHLDHYGDPNDCGLVPERDVAIGAR